MALRESGEMYLEAIHVLSKRGAPVHSVEVGEYLGVSKPSVSRAVGLLKQQELVTADREGHLLLTEQGLAMAEKIYERHTLLTELLMALGVDKDTASADACRIEHHISDASFEALKAWSQKKPQIL